MRSRRSSGSNCVDSAVEPTMSQNITVSCRRSASIIGGEVASDVALAAADWATIGGSAPKAAIAANSLRRWPTEVTPMLIRSSAVSCGSTSPSTSFRRMQVRIVRAPARVATPLRPCGDPRLRGTAAPHRSEDIPLPFEPTSGSAQTAQCRPSKSGEPPKRHWDLPCSSAGSRPRPSPGGTAVRGVSRQWV